MWIVPFFARLTNPNPRKSARKWDKMSTRAFVLFMTMASAVVVLSLSALFQPAAFDPLIERINEPISQLEAEADLGEDLEQTDCATCDSSRGSGPTLPERWAPRGVSRAGHRPNSSISPFGKNLYLSLSLICISPTQYAWFFYCLAHLCYNGYICQNFLK